MAGYDGRGARFDIIGVKGADLSFTVTAVDPDGAPVDLSAATIVGSIYNGGGVAVDTFNAAVSGAGSNVITLSLTDTEVDALVAPRTWALEVTRNSDDRVWLAGAFSRQAPSFPRTSTSGTAVTATVDMNVTVTAQVLTAAGTTGDVFLTDGDDFATASIRRSRWGVTADGDPYYDAAGVAAADRAFMQFNPETGAPVLIRIGA